MTHDEIRKQHFQRLNNYHHSSEYAEYAKQIGAEVPKGSLPSLLGDKWEIDRETYQEFLEVLPPLGWEGGTFYMCEFSFDDITAKFSKKGDKYYCEFARCPERRRSNPALEIPWGPAQHIHVIAPGIVSYSTASHGGIHLSPERFAEMPKPLQEFVPFGGEQHGPGRWYEEDCDWAIVAVAFPQFFTSDDHAAALATIKGYKPELYKEVCKLMGEPGICVRAEQVKQPVDEKAME